MTTASVYDPTDPAGWSFIARQVDVEMLGVLSAHLMFDPRQFDTR